MLNFFTIEPAPQLKQYVRYFWVLEGTASPAAPYVHRTMADGGAEILFHYKGRFDEILRNGQQAGSFQFGIHGPSAMYRRFSINEDFGMIGAYVYPYALPRILKMPASMITDSMNELDSLLGAEGKEIAERIMLAENNGQRVNILNRFFWRKISGYPDADPRLEACIRELIATKGQLPVDLLAAKYFLSTRQFQRLFKNYSGFTPKQFTRITRFQSSLGDFGMSKKSLTAIAYDHGYYDQSHFIHDFREFSGFHPGEYFRKVSEANEWKRDTNQQ